MKKGCVLSIALVLVLSSIPAAWSGTDKLEAELRNACKIGDLAKVESLVGRGVAVNGTDGFGWTPLALAAKEGHAAVVAYLLDHGADPNIPNSWGWYPIGWAAFQGHTEIVRELLKHGANPEAKIDHSWSAATLAGESGRAGVIDVIKSGMPEVVRRKGRSEPVSKTEVKPSRLEGAGASSSDPKDTQSHGSLAAREQATQRDGPQTGEIKDRKSSRHTTDGPKPGGFADRPGVAADASTTPKSSRKVLPSRKKEKIPPESRRVESIGVPRLVESAFPGTGSSPGMGGKVKTALRAVKPTGALRGEPSGPDSTAQSTKGSPALFRDSKGLFSLVPPVGWTMREFPAEKERSRVIFHPQGNSEVSIRVLALPSLSSRVSFYQDARRKALKLKKIFPNGAFSVKRSRLAGLEAVVMENTIPGTIKQEIWRIRGQRTGYVMTFLTTTEDQFREYHSVFESFLDGFRPLPHSGQRLW